MTSAKIIKFSRRSPKHNWTSNSKGRTKVHSNIAALRPVVLAFYNYIHFVNNQDADCDISQVLPTQVPPRGGSCIWGPTS
ncbi:hypothetical protein V1477_007129 [Vespula maculifrons]|uniref:Uncharacterized protein n=1 Tax=Vespula maculifrons TaxID=7453 RepID=A0ABD2CHQ3_VESMC